MLVRILSSNSIRGPAGGHQALEEQMAAGMEEQTAEAMEEVCLTAAAMEEPCLGAPTASSYCR